MVVLIGSIASVLAPIISNELKSIASVDINKISEGLLVPLDDTENFLKNYCLKPENDPSVADHLRLTLQEMVSFSSMSYALDNMVLMMTDIIIGIFSIMFILFFFLKDKDMFFNIILTITPTEYERKVQHSLVIIKKLLTRYFLGIIVQLSLIFIMVSIGLFFAGIDNYLVIAIIAALLNIIPYVGPLIGYIIGIMIGVSTNVDMDIKVLLVPLLLKMTLVFALVHLIDNFLVQPIVFSNSVKAHPLEIFIVILAAATIGGIIGMILAIPAYTVIRVMSKEFFSESKLVKKLTDRLE
jgi:predicted PurR-regulated permease PerM